MICLILWCVFSYIYSSIIVDEVWKYNRNEFSDCSGHGTLDENGFCSCYSNFYGEDCSITDCDGFLSNKTETCSGNGLCIDYNFCVCLSGYSGQYCQDTTCFGTSSTSMGVCSGYGDCYNIDVCTCNSGRIGSECQHTNTSFTHVAAFSNTACPSNTLESVHQMEVEYSTCHSDEFDTRIVCSIGETDYEIEKYELESSCQEYNFIEYEAHTFPVCEIMDNKIDGVVFYTELCGDFISSFDENELLHNGFLIGSHIDSADCSDPPISKEYFKYGVCVHRDGNYVIMRCLDNGNRIYIEIYDDSNCTVFNRIEFDTEVIDSSCKNNQSFHTVDTGCFTECWGNYSWEPETQCSDRGICIDLNNCSCDVGFYGPNCEHWLCWNVSYDSEDVCSGHGRCVGYDECDCITGFHGKNCETQFWYHLTGVYNQTQESDYGCQQEGNTPGGRFDGGQFYVDPNNKFWLFGGINDKDESYNDVWYFFGGKWCFARGDEGVFGSPGLPPAESGLFNASVLPPASYGHSLFGTSNIVSFFSIFGDRPPDGESRDTNELWEFNYVFMEWRVIRGHEEDSDAEGVPGPRRHSCVVVSQDWNNSVAYIFGGTDESRLGGSYNDLWAYDIMNDTFTLLTGSYYDTSQTNVSFSDWVEKGVFSNYSIPQPRSGCSCWMEKDHIYVFGGMQVYDGQFGVNNDVWVYNITLNLWGYLYGNRSIENKNLIRNIYGFGNDSVNVPGTRKYPSFWKLSADMFYLFGGVSMENNIFGDVWVFDISTNLFKFENGTEFLNVLPTPYTMGSRYHSYSGIDESLRVKIFGGYTYD